MTTKLKKWTVNDMRLINADELMELYADSKDFSIAMCNVPIPIIRQNILDMPTIDAVPVRYGKWKLNRDGSGTCNQCRCTQLNVWDYDNWQNFCGHCGADMRREFEGSEK